jgi:Fe2+ transport system protein FeoA
LGNVNIAYPSEVKTNYFRSRPAFTFLQPNTSRVEILTTTTTWKSTIAPAAPRQIISHFTNDQVAGKLMSMGVLPGSEIRLIRKAPFGGGWYVQIDRQILALRKDELDCIVTKQW